MLVWGCLSDTPHTRRREAQHTAKGLRMATLIIVLSLWGLGVTSVAGLAIALNALHEWHLSRKYRNECVSILVDAGISESEAKYLYDLIG